MPSGYTSQIYAGEDQSFEDFLLTCARAFVAELRDEPLAALHTAQMPRESSYHRDELAKDRRELEMLQGLSENEIEEMRADEHRTRVGQIEEMNEKSRALKARYETMLKSARAWEPPTESHQGLKKFMIEQLLMSIEGDCHITDIDKEKAKWLQETPKEWLQKKIDFVTRSIAYHEESQERERERYEISTKWRRELFESIGVEVPA